MWNVLNITVVSQLQELFVTVLFGFSTKSVHVGFVMDKVAFGEVLLESFSSPRSVSFYCCYIFTHISSRGWTRAHQRPTSTET
jgi:hypothetical protein